MATPERLAVIWSSGDREVALSMVLMYTFNAKVKGWWDGVRLLVWGPSARLLAEDTELQSRILEMQEAGVMVQACKACAEMHGVTSHLEDLGIEVLYVGETFTDILKSESYKVITF